MTLGRFDNATASDISAGLAPPTSVRKSDVEAVRKNYNIDAGFKPKGLSDTSLYAHSVKFVLEWWKKNSPEAIAKQQADEAAAEAAAAAAAASKAAASKAFTPGAVVKPPTVSSPTTSPSVTPLKAAGFTPSSYMSPIQAPQLSSEGRALLAIPPLTSAQATSIMTQMGLKGVTPPKTALVSTTALRAWVTATLAKINMTGAQKVAAGGKANMARNAG